MFPIGTKITTVRWANKTPKEWVKVLFYGADSFFCISDFDVELVYSYDLPWIVWKGSDGGVEGK